MTRLIAHDIRRFLSSAWFWGVVAIGWLALVFNAFENRDMAANAGTLNRFLVSGVLYGGGIVSVILPLLCVLPFGCALWEDISSDFLQPLAARLGYARYGLARAISTALSGGLVGLLIFGGFFLGLLLYDPSPSAMIHMNFAACAFGTIYLDSMLAYCLVYLAGVFAFGAINALLCMGLSGWFKNQFVGWGAPLLIYHCGYYLVFLLPDRIGNFPLAKALLSFIPYYTYILPGLTYTWMVVSQFACLFLLAAIAIFLTLRRRYLQAN